MQHHYAIFYIFATVSASAVHNLTAAEFDSFITSHNTSLVAFIAPWCNFCQELDPAYESVASTLQEEDVPVARVDCVEEKDLCNEYRIPIFPTIRVFHDKEHTVYNGPRKAEDMVSFARRHKKPIVSHLLSADDVALFRTIDNITILGYYDEDDHTSETMFTDIAKQKRGDYLFGSTSDDTFGKAEAVKKPSIVLYKDFDEGKNVYEGRLNTEEVEEFLFEATSPLVRKVGVDIKFVPGSFAERPVAVIFAETEEQRKELTEQLRPIAKATKGKVVWFAADPIEYANDASNAALTPGKWPAFAIQDTSKDFKFAFPKRGSLKELSSKAIQQVMDDFLAGKLESSIKSDPIPTSQEGPVITVVADNYHEMIIDNDRDVIVLFYSPTCPHCIAVEPSYEELGKVLEPFAKKIMVAKINAISNDVWPRLSSYPTLKLFRSGEKDKPILYRGNRSLVDFVNFIKENGSGGVAEALAKLPEVAILVSNHDEL